MATYTIIGGDQKEYGPVTADDVRQWIAEDRLSDQSMVKVEGDAEFRTLKSFPEFADAFLDRANAAGPVPPLGPVDWSERDYELDMGGCISRGWQHVKSNFGTLFLSVLVMAVVGFAFFTVLGLVVSAVVPKGLMAIPPFKVGFNYAMSAVSALVMGPMVGGLYLVYLKSIRDQAVGAGDVFAGFQQAFSQLVLGSLAVTLATGLCMAPFNYLIALKVNPLLAQMQNASPAEIQKITPQLMAALGGTLPILLICLVPVTYLSVNWLFTQALIIDKRIDFRTAMRTSWKMVHKHWWHVFGLVVLTGLLNLAGCCFCCVGLLFTGPVGFAALMFAYETIFSEGPAA